MFVTSGVGGRPGNGLQPSKKDTATNPFIHLHYVNNSMPRISDFPDHTTYREKQWKHWPGLTTLGFPLFEIM